MVILEIMCVLHFLQLRDYIQAKDYKHTFSPVAKFTTVRLLIAIDAMKDWPLYQLDFNNTFLHGFIDEVVYMSPPDGYGKWAKRQNIELSKFLIKLGFHQSKFDHSVFLWDSPKGFIVVIVYVDDLLVTSVSSELIRFIKDELNMAFTIKGLGLVR
ncbi:hypothetical protein V2J09_020841 [Rumex salicifolius]